MNENKKQALKIILDYIFYDDTEENNSQMQNEIDNYLNRELSNQSLLNQFETVANKIDELDDEIKEIKKSLKETNPNVDVADNTSVSEITQKNNETTVKKPKKTKSKKKKKLSETAKKVLSYIPEMTEAEADEYFKRIRSKCEGLNSTQIKKILVRDATAANIAKKLGIRSTTVNNYFVHLKKRDDIRFIPVNNARRAALVYVRVIPEPEPQEKNINSNSIYQFKAYYSNPGYELINNMYIKTKKGKPLDVTAEQLKELSKLVDGKGLTICLFNDCCDYLKGCDVPESDFECIIQHLIKGYFNRVLSEYNKYLKKKFNARFEEHNGTLLVDGKDTKLTIKEVKTMIDNYPYGFSDEKIEEYTRGLIDKYTFCPAECIRCIVSNYDNYSLTSLLKKNTGFVENNPQKRKEKGIIQ